MDPIKNGSNAIILGKVFFFKKGVIYKAGLEYGCTSDYLYEDLK